MGQTVVATPTSRLRFGHARVDVTPPVGIYNRMWGAARHDRATGVHRPLHANVMVLESPDRAQRLVRAELDLCGLAHSVYERLAAGLAEAAGVAREQVSIGFSTPTRPAGSGRRSDSSCRAGSSSGPTWSCSRNSSVHWGRRRLRRRLTRRSPTASAGATWPPTATTGTTHAASTPPASTRTGRPRTAWSSAE